MPITADLVLSTLANGVVVATNLTTFGLTKVRCISADLSWSLNGATALEGPIVVGLASGDLSVTEIAEKLDAAPTSRSDRVQMEQGGRPVRSSGRFPVLSSNEVIDNGNMKRTKCPWFVDEGIELLVWARNKSGATLTTGAIVRVQGTLYMTWA